MDLSPAQQKAVFVLVVVVLAALGYWLLLPKLTHSGGGHPAAAATVSSMPPAASSTASAPASAPPATTTAGNGTGTGTGTGTGNVNIYSWLPFTQQGLADAAAVTQKFCVDYNTFTYTETATAYVAKMNGLIAGQLGTQLQASYSTPGVATLRKSEQQVSTGTATISSLRAYGDSSLTFVVNAGQHLVSSKGTTNGSTQYAVTVTGSGTSWQVDDIELASAGNS